MNPGPSAHECSMSPISCVQHRSGTVQVNWSRPTDSGSTENARVENLKLFKILFKLLYLRFPPLQIRTCVFRTCIFHPCTFVLTYSVLAYSIPRYFRFPYLRFQSPQYPTFLQRNMVRPLCCIFTSRILVALKIITGWLGSRVVSVLDSGAEGPGFKSQPRAVG